MNTDKILKRLGIVTVNPFKINRKISCFAPPFDKEILNDNYVIDTIYLNLLMRENRQGENCKNCEIQWTYYNSQFDSFAISNLIHRLEKASIK